MSSLGLRRLVFWLPRHIRQLDDAAAASLTAIGTRIEQRTITVDDETVAWGQYLDERYTGQQWGLLGTSAATQILAANDPLTDPYSRGGLVAKSRPIVFDDPGTVSPLLSRQIARGELRNIVRLASVAEALMLHRRDVIPRSEWPPLVHTIVDLRNGNPWWSSESASGSATAGMSGSPFVTAFIVHALRRYECDKCFDDARVWLIDHIADQWISRRLDLIALIGLALLGREARTDQIEIQRGIVRCQNAIVGRRGRVRKVIVDRPIFLGYSVDDRTDYAFLNPEMLCALFLLRSTNPIPGRRFVLRAVRATTQHIAINKGFDTELGGEATVEQLWAARLLQAFQARARSPELHKSLRPRVFLGRAAAIVVLLAVAVLGIGVILWAGGDTVGGAVGVGIAIITAVVTILLSGPDE